MSDVTNSISPSEYWMACGSIQGDAGVEGWATKSFRLAPNGTNLGLLLIRTQQGCQPRFVPFGAQYGTNSAEPKCTEI